MFSGPFRQALQDERIVKLLSLKVVRVLYAKFGKNAIAQGLIFPGFNSSSSIDPCFQKNKFQS